MDEFKILSDQEIWEVHSAALEVLSEVGVKIESKRARKLLKEAGKSVDDNTKIVKFQIKLIEECIAKAPQKVFYGGIDRNHDLILEPNGKVFSRPITGAERYIDLDTREYRKPMLADLNDWVKVCDALDNISYCTGIYPWDVTTNLRDLYVAKSLLENTKKHIELQPYGGKWMEYIIQMVLTVQTKKELKENPIISVLTSTTSPLHYLEYASDILFLAGEYGIPVELNTMSIAGATGPVTLAGNLMLSHAEILLAIVLAQLANPGAPLVYRPLPMVLEMSTGVALDGTAENAMIAAASVQLAKACCNSIPANVFGQVSDSLATDEQSMIERSFNTLLPALAGANIVSGAGQVEHCYTCDLVQLAIDDEILGMTDRILKGIEINRDTLGVDAFKRVGPGGNFLADEHTLKYFKSEYYKPHAFNRMARIAWDEKGRKGLHENARERVKRILEEHDEILLDQKLAEELDLILAKAEEDNAQNKWE